MYLNWRFSSSPRSFKLKTAGTRSGIKTLPRKTPLQWGGIEDLLAGGPWHPGHVVGQLCALAMCCHLLGAVIPNHVLGISCFLFYLFFY